MCWPLMGMVYNYNHISCPMIPKIINRSARLSWGLTIESPESASTPGQSIHRCTRNAPSTTAASRRKLGAWNQQAKHVTLRRRVIYKQELWTLRSRDLPMNQGSFGFPVPSPNDRCVPSSKCKGEHLGGPIWVRRITGYDMPWGYLQFCQFHKHWMYKNWVSK